MKTNYPVTFLKGLLMGICDAIPGISGGTIAFITGIYERLINAIKGFSFSLVVSLFRGNKKKIKKLDLGFLATLFLGIMVAILIFSRLMSYLLDNYFPYTIVFFFGLILASAKTIFDHIERHHTGNVMLMVVGLLVGLSLVLIVPVSLTPSLLYVVLGGFVAISAMVLPGISGAFILLVMGLYRFVLGLIRDFPSNIEYLLVFAFGAVLGILTITRVVSWLFKKDKSKTLYFLLGLVIGGLSVPARDFVSSASFDLASVVYYVVLFLVGAYSAVLIRRIAKK